MSILARIFGGNHQPPPIPSKGDLAYDAVMNESDNLLKRMKESSQSTDAARAVMADIWSQRRNVPFLTTVYEAVQEAKSGPEQRQKSS